MDDSIRKAILRWIAARDWKNTASMKADIAKENIKRLKESLAEAIIHEEQCNRNWLDAVHADNAAEKEIENYLRIAE